MTNARTVLAAPAKAAVENRRLPRRKPAAGRSLPAERR